MEVAHLINKYRVHEVAKDFGKNSKEIADILTQYATAPKNHMQVLEDSELSLIFDYLTQKYPVENMESIFADVYHEPKPAPQKPQQKPAQNQVQGQQQNRGQGQKGQRPAAAQPSQPPKQKSGGQGGQASQPAQNHPNNQAGQANQSSQPAQQPARPASRIPAKKVVDTRKGGDVNLAKYDERLETLAAGKTTQMQAGKQKFQGRNNQRRGGGYQGSKRRQEEQEKMRRLQAEIAKKNPLKVLIPDEIGVGELASRMKKTGAEVVKQLMKNGVMASMSDVIDFDTAAIIAEDLGCKVEKEVIVTIEERLIDTTVDKEEDLKPRAPVVVVMGHVDHGKTSLLDYIRNSNVASGEAGGITQHIGAYQVKINDQPITFLDTPGHEAFTAMRARGAMITDVAILVVAADDGIMPQTVESINHAKAAKIPIIVAINKMDKPEANPDRIKQQLTEYELVPEEWGGETIICPISAKTGQGIDTLLEMVVLTAEMKELKANPNRTAHGAVIEARLDRGRGPVATLLVQNGTLHQGDVIIAGTAVGRVRAMTNAKGQKLTEAGPSVPVEIIGMSEVPDAGDDFHAVADERMARELAGQRKHEQKTAAAGPMNQKVSLEDLFSQIKQGEMKELAIIVKADVQGSAEAVKASLEKLTNEEVRVRVIHCAVGAINESDVMLASTSNAIIVGFNVRPDNNAKDSAARSGVDMRMYRVIYDCIDEIEAAMKGMLAPKFKEVELGRVEVREVYKITGAGIVAGCYVTDGKVMRSAQIRLLRDNIVIHEGAIGSLRRFKDDVKEVAQGYECGISIEKYSDIKVGDVIEAFVMEQIEV
ncbi:MAG: translation initiation factor IF-2 [Oscillospiraceae bacterium]|nr:translation initiation factor IF-2 [Oscillospiraceae bacterium]